MEINFFPKDNQHPPTHSIGRFAALHEEKFPKSHIFLEGFSFTCYNKRHTKPRRLFFDFFDQIRITYYF